jgi:hypothetical protein
MRQAIDFVTAVSSTIFAFLVVGSLSFSFSAYDNVSTKLRAGLIF